MSRRKTILTAVVLILIMLIGGMLAFFTDADEENKVFILGNVKVQFTKESVTSFQQEISKLTPNKTISQKAELENVGDNDAYIFVKVKVPHISVSVNGDAATKKDLFSTNIQNSQWKELEDASKEEGNYYSHVYAYATGDVLTKLVGKSGETIQKVKVFDQITFINVSNPEEITSIFSEGNLDVDVTGYAIQADDLGSSDPSEVWKNLEKNLVKE